MLRQLSPLFLFCLLWFPTPLLAQATTWQDLSALIDEVVLTQLFLDDIPGAAVALVGDGEVRHLGGYGYADREARTPVQADRTLFGTGSVSKLLTWTAVMQLVEQGELDLDRDINSYLTGMQIPATWPQPVTLAHLLTHTAGFEERAFGFYARRPADLVPLPAFVAGHLPARVRPPGKVSAYSNYGAALAGHVVARAAGMPFERVIETRILEPLGMSRSSFRQPLPMGLAPDLATGYRGTNGRAGHGWYQARPSGALRATAADMAQFMLAHLQAGRLGDARILEPASIAAMQRRQFGNHPTVSGMTYGFQELQRGGQRILWHPGDTRYFTAALFLLPEPGLGLFVAHNQAGTRALQLELLDAILAHLWPDNLWPASPAADFDSGASARLAGYYRSTRSAATSLERIFEPFKLARVREVEPGMLNIHGLAMVEDAFWIEQSPGVFRDSVGEEIIVFHVDAADGGTRLYEGNVPVFAYTRLPWYAAPTLQASLLAGCALVFLTAVIAWSWRSGHTHSRAVPAPWPLRLARPVGSALCLTNLAFLAGLLLLLGLGQHLLYGAPSYASVIMMLPRLSAVLNIAAVFLAVIAWQKRSWTLPGRLHYSLVMATGLVFLGALHALELP